MNRLTMMMTTMMMMMRKEVTNEHYKHHHHQEKGDNDDVTDYGGAGNNNEVDHDNDANEESLKMRLLKMIMFVMTMKGDWMLRRWAGCDKTTPQ